MNKRYMDFVPVKKSRVRASVVNVETEELAVEEIFEEKPMEVESAKIEIKMPNEAPRMPRAVSEPPRVMPNKISKVAPKSPRVMPRVVTESSPSVASNMSSGVGVVAKSSYMVARSSDTAVKPSDAVGAGGVKLGVIEDLSPRFVRTEVPKRALGGSTTARVEAKEVKSEKLVGKTRVLPRKSGGVASSGVAEPRKMIKSESLSGGTQDDKQVLKVPKFVNTDKIKKRPLSKTVYNRDVMPPKEEPQGPVTIIAKPEKDSKVGMIVAVIITIILGAAAGTVAFLLLPK